jgi:hypothetical protein
MKNKEWSEDAMQEIIDVKKDARRNNQVLMVWDLFKWGM